MALRAELYCYFCGHGLGEVLVSTSARRPTVEQLRTAYDNVRGREATTSPARTPRARGGGGPRGPGAPPPPPPRCAGLVFQRAYEKKPTRATDPGPWRPARTPPGGKPSSFGSKEEEHISKLKLLV